MLWKRQLPLCEQPGAVQCAKCHCWLRSRSGLALHKCLNVSSSSSLTMSSLSTLSSFGHYHLPPLIVPRVGYRSLIGHAVAAIVVNVDVVSNPSQDFNGITVIVANAVQKKTAVNFLCLAHVDDVSRGSRTNRDISADSNYLARLSALPIYGQRGQILAVVDKSSQLCVCVCVCVCMRARA